MSSLTLRAEITRAIQVATRTGQVAYGARRISELALHGKAKLIILASNTPPELRHDIEHYAKLSRIPVIVFEGTNIELGNVVGRPHSVTALAIIDPGQSRILDLVKQVSND
ncbi:MAG: 50S ribosomal protein L30e [Desulfurococcaceae archaeon]